MIPTIQRWRVSVGDLPGEGALLFLFTWWREGRGCAVACNECGTMYGNNEERSSFHG